MIKKFLSLLTAFIIGVLMSSVALAVTTIDFVKVNGDIVKETGNNFILDVDRGDDLDIKIRLSQNGSNKLNDVQVEVVLRGIDSRQTVDDIQTHLI